MLLANSALPTIPKAPDQIKQNQVSPRQEHNQREQSRRIRRSGVKTKHRPNETQAQIHNFPMVD